MKLTDEEEITKKSYDKHGRAWARKYKDEEFYKKEYSKLKSLLPGGRVIDIGCGSGRDAKVLIGLGYDYVGVDISDTLLDICKQKLPKAEFLKSSVYDLSFSDKFDGFWCTAVLLHVPHARIDEAMVSIESVIRPGAVGFLTIKDGAGEELEDFEIEGENLTRFYAYWSRDDFEDVLKKHQFKIVDYNYRPVNSRQQWHCFFVQYKATSINSIDKTSKN